MTDFNLQERFLVVTKYLYDPPLLEAHHYCGQGGYIVATYSIFAGNSTDTNPIGIDSTISTED